MILHHSGSRLEPRCRTFQCDPQFCSGGGDTTHDGHFLKQENDEQGWAPSEWSPCIDAGDPCDNSFSDPTNTEYSTGVNGFLDTDTVDMSCHFKYFGCTFIQLVSFEARPENGSIMLTCETGAEIDNAGFVLFRNLAGTCDYVHMAISSPHKAHQVPEPHRASPSTMSSRALRITTGRLTLTPAASGPPTGQHPPDCQCASNCE